MLVREIEKTSKALCLRGFMVVATGLEEKMGLFLSINDDQKRRFFKGFLTITNNEKQPRTTPVGVRVGVSVGVRKTSCIAPLSVGLSKK
jgi:hypothetical protein